MWNPLHQDSVIHTFRLWINQIPNPVFQRQLMATLQSFEESAWIPALFKTRILKHLPDLTVTKRGLIFAYPLSYDRVQLTFKTYLAAVETQSDIFSTREAVDYVVFKVQQAGKVLSPNGVKYYIDQNEIDAIRVNETCFFARTALDEFIARYTRAVSEQRLQAAKSIGLGTQV